MKFTINSTPTGQMRPRACIRGRHAGSYKDKKQEQREQTLAALLEKHVPGVPLDGPLLLYVNAVFPCPASKPKKWRQDALSGRIRHIAKPDADNIAKHLKDVMTELQFWHDDKQVADLVVRKWYGTAGRWDIRIEAAECAPLGFPEQE